MPHLVICRRLPVRPARPRSAAKTPYWQVTDESTSTVVLTAANGRSSLAVSWVHRSGETLRIVKYAANRPAKNSRSLESHTMVPTATIDGRPSVP
jgi:hypothetical protein